jgi:hypothetical protein
MVKKYLTVLLLAIVFLGVIYAVYSMRSKSDKAVYTRHHTWYVDASSSGTADSMVRGGKVGLIRNDANLLVAALNKCVEDAEIAQPRGDGGKAEVPRITLQKIEGGTADIDIENDQYLTQKMGSSGAQDYLASVTYTLTENPGIKAVNFRFHEGDHAMPGIYTRESFTAYKTAHEK